MLQLARRMSRARPSAIMMIAEKAKRLKAEGRDIISFSIGVPNFLPADHVYAAAREALAKDSGTYGSNRGMPELLDAFLAHLKAAGIDGYGREHLAVGIGAKQVLYNIMEAVLDEGDEVVIPAPYWTSYVDMAEICGAKITTLPCPASQNYKLTPEQLDAALSENTKLFLFNNPSNPTGMVYSREEIAALAEVLVKYPTWIIADDIYNRMVFDGLGYHNLVNARPELRDRVIIVDSISKTYGMPGWRVGMMAGPAEIANAVVTLNSNHITNIPDIAAIAAVAALSGPQDVTETKCREFQGKRDRVMALFDSLPGVVTPKPQGAFYVFPDISCSFGRSFRGQRIDDDLRFCELLLESQGVACVPGSAFGEPRGMRISYTCPDHQLDEGLRRIGAFFAEIA